MGRKLALILSCAFLSVVATGGTAQASRNVSATSNARIICMTFGKYCTQAIRVASCESGLNVYAHNGQYLGMFQMGSYARARYGHSYSAYGQARAAYRYFRDSGYSWGPWSCKPW